MGRGWEAGLEVLAADQRRGGQDRVGAVKLDKHRGRGVDLMYSPRGID